MKKNKLKNNSGFTLVETLVAISIFTLSVLALLSILSSGISDISYAKQRMTANYLAQEGIEYIRNLRDTYVFYNVSSGWSNFTTAITPCTTASCLVNPANIVYTNHTQPITAIVPFSTCTSACAPLKYDSSSGVYGYSTGSTSAFTRTITASIVNANEIVIYSTVSWNQNNHTNSTVYSEDLTNWTE